LSLIIGRTLSHPANKSIQCIYRLSAAKFDNFYLNLSVSTQDGPRPISSSSERA